MKLKNRSKHTALTATVLAVLFLISGQPITAGQFPSGSQAQHSYAGGNVTLSKSAVWTDAAKEHAEVTLTFDGLSQVIAEEETADVLFILDTSASMGYQDGCINPEHFTATTLRINDNTFADYGLTGYSFTANLLPLIKTAVTSGVINQTQFNSTHILNENVLIPVPNLVGAPLYLYPMKTDFNGYTYKTLDYTVYTQAAWGLVDFSRSTYISTASTYYPWYWYHFKLDAGGHKVRLGYHNNGGGNGDYNPFWIDGTLSDGKPKWWDMSDNGCILKARAEYDALSAFTDDLLTNSPDSRIAFAAFNRSARQTESTEYLEFTSDANAVADYLTILSKVTDQTNYEAGMMSAKDVLDTDPGKDNGHKKIVIFVTDGMPNYACVNGNLTQVAAADMGTAFEKANAVMDEIKAAYPDVTVCTACCSIVNPFNIDNYIKPFMTSDGAHYTVDTYTDEQNPFIGAFNALYNEYILTTKIVTVSDIIDNRYFTVDGTALNAPGTIPDKCTVQVENITVDSLTMQRVTFTYKADADQDEIESLKIPLLFVNGAVAPTDVDPANTEYYPTNYDPSGTNGGASCGYTYLDGTDKTIEAARVWLLRNVTYIPVLHDVFGGVDQAENQGAVILEDWPAKTDTDKDIYIENAGTGKVYVRVKLTETVTGGNDNYNIQSDPYTGCAPFSAYTSGMAVNNPAYKAAFAEDITLSHSIIDWTLGSPVFDLTTWDGTATGKFWLMDKTTGWAYWMEVLAPGHTTNKFLTALYLREEQNGLGYTIDVEADAISATETADIYQWTKDNYRQSGNDVGDAVNIQKIFDVFYAQAAQ